MAQLYVVKRGDTLRRIAEASLGDAKLFRWIAEFNGLRDPDRLVAGQRLEIPARRDLEPPAAPPGRARLGPPGAPLAPPHGLKALLAEFGDLYACLRDDGTLDPRWETEQLVRVRLPFPLALSWDPARAVRAIHCHRRLAAVFPAVFEELQRRGLRGNLRTFGGCFNFRAKRSSNKLSTHCWGIAVDLNPETNALGRAGDMPGAVVEVFESFGFAWGGRWPGRGKDPMHFQYCSGY